MCRSNKDGGRRCPGCGGFKAVAKANGNRPLGRLARKIVVDHNQGFDVAGGGVTDERG